MQRSVWMLMLQKTIGLYRPSDEKLQNDDPSGPSSIVYPFLYLSPSLISLVFFFSCISSCLEPPGADQRSDEATVVQVLTEHNNDQKADRSVDRCGCLFSLQYFTAGVSDLWLFGIRSARVFRTARRFEILRLPCTSSSIRQDIWTLLIYIHIF